MSYKDVYWGDRGHCPKCGRFVGHIRGFVSSRGLERVTGICSGHGEVDISHQEWAYEDFPLDEENPE